MFLNKRSAFAKGWSDRDCTNWTVSAGPVQYWTSSRVPHGIPRHYCIEVPQGNRQNSIFTALVWISFTKTYWPYSQSMKEYHSSSKITQGKPRYIKTTMHCQNTAYIIQKHLFRFADRIIILKWARSLSAKQRIKGFSYFEISLTFILD